VHARPPLPLPMGELLRKSTVLSRPRIGFLTPSVGLLIYYVALDPMSPPHVASCDLQYPVGV
jgi:hypothetical protein